jgi:hypothetical protein
LGDTDAYVHDVSVTGRTDPLTPGDLAGVVRAFSLLVLRVFSLGTHVFTDSKMTGVTTSDTGSSDTGSDTDGTVAASDLISNRIAELDDWRGETLARMRKLITESNPDVIEEWKWRGVPVWSLDGIICTGESYKEVVKLTFQKGAALNDTAGLFNSSLEGNVRRAIDIREGEVVDEAAFTDLVAQAIELNKAKPAKPAKKTKS